MSAERFNLLSFTGKMKILHLSWMVFFVTFIVWFNHAPLLKAIGNSLALTPQQLKTLLTLNVAIAIPARVIIGMLVKNNRTYMEPLNGACVLFKLVPNQ